MVGMVVIVLAIMYLVGFKVGTALAICSIIEVLLSSIHVTLVKQIYSNKKKGKKGN